MLKQRVLTALLLLPIALAGIFMLPITGFSVAVAVVIVLAAREWGALVLPGQPAAKWLYGASIAALLVALLLLVPSSLIWVDGHLHPLYHGLLVAGVLWWLAALALVLTFPESAAKWQNSLFAKVIFGQLTLLPCFAALLALKAWPGTLDGAWLVLSVLLLVWGADTGAYFVGKAIGKNKLIPKVSPGKTREGLLGGMAVCALLSLIGWQLVPSLSLVEALLLGMVTAFASALGDLAESMFKRAANIKDSGSLLPGHGGVLDRIDSVTAAMPVFAFLYLLFGA
ncbi:phosphatidate cytidylyltransferase [Ferrimonas marina]|uniref:Phosphatidate cytidylyltransferase n=1 Tax=Ferrimonas marina TaxID=299255 RepID=A0A1M5YFC8_9GAMM|nr:phosphatidate cytidylyltransferase [Ferrimonas marina]SHI10750.1 phosphatidate cytidylyltransferase [Ferrimonas marina]